MFYQKDVAAHKDYHKDQNTGGQISFPSQNLKVKYNGMWIESVDIKVRLRHSVYFPNFAFSNPLYGK